MYIFNFIFLSFVWLYRLHEVLMQLQQKQLKDLRDWLTKTEQFIDDRSFIGDCLEAVNKQIDDIRVSSYWRAASY